MNLFNEYENKNLQFLLNYLNFATDFTAITEEEFELLLNGSSEKLTSAEIIDCILNRDKIDDTPKSRNQKQSNLNLFYRSDDCINSVMSWDTLLPERTTKAERSWLKMILADSKADFFLFPYTKAKLSSVLDADDAPDITGCFDTRSMRKTPTTYSEQDISHFKSLVSVIKNKLPLELSYSDPTGSNTNVFVYPYKLKYDELYDRISLLAFDSKTACYLEISLEDILYCNPAPSLAKQRSYPDFIFSALNTHKVKTPITLEIMDTDLHKSDSARNTMAVDRAGYYFSNYTTKCYEDDHKLVIDIFYYDFQKQEVIRKILALGRFVRVLAPDSIRQEVIDELQAKLK